MGGTPSLTFGVVLSFFGLIQVVALIMLIIIRYHLREFLPANDARGKMIVLVMSLGVFMFLIVSGVFAYLILNQ